MSEPRALVSVFKSATTILPVFIVYSFCLLLTNSVYAQDCSTADGFPNTRLGTQADVDNFQTDYGPCDTITRDLIIDGGPFTNLFGLADIVSIVGDLVIFRSSVASLEGLSNLTNITGLLHIESQLAPSFTSLSELSSLTNLGGLDIEDTNYLFTLSGLSVLASLEYVRIFNARILTNLTGLSVGVNANLSASLTATTMESASLPADLGIKTLILESNDALESLDGLSPIIGLQELFVSDNPNLTSISALAGSVFNDVYTLPFDQAIPSLRITRNPKLSSLNGLPSVLAPGAFRDLFIFDNPLITSLSELNGVVEIWEEAAFFDNAALSDCAALSTVMDPADDGFPGPNEYTSDPTTFPPDLRSPNDNLPLGSNAPGCNSIAEILGSSSVEGVFMDGFETK